MSEFITSTLILAAEFGAIASIFFLIFVAIAYFKRKKETNIASDFTNKFKESTDARRETLEQAIYEAFQVSSDEGKGAVNEIMDKERTIHSNVLKIFKGKDKELILNLSDDLENLSVIYHKLANIGQEQTPSSIGDGDSEGIDRESIESELNVLKIENQRLKDDLKKSLENIDYLQTQYTELFERTKH